MSVMLEAIDAYQCLLADPPPTKADRLAALAECLDRLSMAYHQTPDVESKDDDRSLPEPIDYNEMRQLIAPQFPELGLYASIEAGPPTNLNGLTGDAIDDLVDIASDLQEVAWRAEHVSLDDAAWHFRFGYLTHWGQHLVELRLHLHYLLRKELV